MPKNPGEFLLENTSYFNLLWRSVVKQEGVFEEIEV